LGGGKGYDLGGWIIPVATLKIMKASAGCTHDDDPAALGYDGHCMLLLRG
jgi:hypothetical protein